ncbi:hypothetical protein BKI52_14160 [marine bacterium AO1-C]|nr:hypothetical protein BKI52_14160 [marine bacterium AO1-C]
MITFILTLVTALGITPNHSGATNEAKINQNYLYQHWVMSAKEAKKGIVEYCPFQVADQKNIAARVKYSGIVFEKSGQLLKYRWRKSSVNRGPSYDKYKWSWKKSQEKAILNIASKIGKGQNYEVIELSKNKLKIRLIGRR